MTDKPLQISVIPKGRTILFLAGLEALDESSTKVVGLEDVEFQSTRIMERMRDELESIGSSLEETILLHVYLIRSEDRGKCERVIGRFFQSPPTTQYMKVENLAIPGMLIEIEGTVALKSYQETQGERMKRETIIPDKLCPPVGPFSYGCVVRPESKIFYLAAVGPLDAQGKVVKEVDMKAQIEQTLENIRQILQGQGASLENVVHLRMYTTDIRAFTGTGPWRVQRFPEIWNQPQSAAATTLLEVKSLSRPEFLVEFEAIAAVRE